jgi:formylmethanofuran dehydrogenase subunit C
MRRIKVVPLELDRVPVEAECISPDRFSNLRLDEIRDLEVWHGNRRKKIRELFSVSGDDETGETEDTAIIIEGDFSKVKRIGEAMTGGTIDIRGNVGMHTGNRMRGGTIRALGDAGDWLGREMISGKITVSGDAGNYVGSGYRGESCGMRGGEIRISGSAGLYLGEHMCGGEIAVGGDAGDFPGVANRGGTITIGGDTYLPGAEMTSGKIIIHGRGHLLPSFQIIETVEIDDRPYLKLRGDLVENGSGEIYIVREHVET